MPQRSKTTSNVFVSSLITGAATVIGGYIALLLLSRIRSNIQVQVPQQQVDVYGQTTNAAAGGGCGCQANS